jgi:hypothetical protein
MIYFIVANVRERITFLIKVFTFNPTDEVREDE